MTDLTLTILIPCLNEVNSIGICIEKAKKWLEDNNVSGEVLVSDNGSTDGSIELSEQLGARVVRTPQKGYGSALMGGINNAYGKYIIMGDADDSYDFSKLELFYEKLTQGHDLVMGNRFKGGIKKGAMPFLHKYLGNPVLTFIGNLFFHTKCGDFHCGLRGFNRSSILALNLRTTGMEFASEMVIKSCLNKLSIAEVPTVLSPDKRGRAPHLRTWRDGWRHLRFLLMYSPRWLFLYPGIFLFALGMTLSLGAFNEVEFSPVKLGVHSLLFGAVGSLVGFQLINFAFMTKVFAIREGLLAEDKKLNSLFNFVNLEKGLVVGVLLLVAGLFYSCGLVSDWASSNYSYVEPISGMKRAIPGSMAILFGISIIFNSFFYSILGLSGGKEK